MDNPTTQQQSVEAFVSHFLEGAFSKDVKGTVKISYPEIYSLQRFYNRLYLMDMKKNLRPTLPLMGTTLAFAQSAQEIWAQQQAEIDYLVLHHPKLPIGHLFSSELPTLKILEARHLALNNINKNIIIEKMGTNNFIVDLKLAHITRFSMKLFEEQEKIDFFKTCRNIDLGCNQITMLDLREFTHLEHLWCHNNQLVGLCTQELDRLQLLDCSFNPPLRLNVQKCSSLQKLCYENTSFINLVLTGAHPNLIEQLSELAIELAFQNLTLLSIHPSMETDEENEVTAQVTESQTEESSEHEESIEAEAANFYSLDEQLLHPSYLPSLENRAPKRKRVPDAEGPESKKTKKIPTL